MRKLIMLTAAATMAAATPVSVQADPPGRDPAPEVLAFCHYQMTLDPTLKLGKCMSYFLSGDPGYLTQFCHYLEDNDLLDGESFAQCVQDFHQGG